MKILITGGHLSPALAVIQKIPITDEVIFVGRKYSMEGDMAQSLEYKAIKELNIPFVSITTGRLQRKFSVFTLFTIFKIPIGIIQAFSILTKYKPNVVLTFGGYVSIPISIVAYFLKVPVVIHEQTLQSGLANKLVAIFANKVCVSFDSSKNFFPKEKVILTGNPIREFKKGKFPFSFKEKDSKLPLLYITGGSQGAHQINEFLKKCIERLVQKYRIIHQTGDARLYKDIETLTVIKNSLPEELRLRYILTKFVNPEDVFEVMKKSDLILSRSGINTITEIINVEKPAILIPLSVSQKNEQLKNAQFLETLGLGVVLQKDKVTPEKLIETIDSVFNNIHKYKVSQEKKALIIKPNAALHIIDIVHNVSSPYNIK